MQLNFSDYNQIYGAALDTRMKVYDINSTRMALANQMGTLLSATANLAPGSAEAKQLENRIKSIHQLDKSLEVQGAALQIQEKFLTAWDERNRQIEKEHRELMKRINQIGWS